MTVERPVPAHPPADTEHAPEINLRWSVTYATATFGAGLTFAFTNGALPLFLASYGLPNAAIGLLAQDRPPLAGVSQVVVGALSDRTRSRLGRRRPYILAGIPLAATAAMLLALRPPVWVVIGVLVVMTTSLAVAYGPYLALLPDLVPSELRGRVGAVQATANMLGQIVMLLLASQLWPAQEGWVFAVVAIGLLVPFAITFLGIRERPAVHVPPPVRFAPMDYVRGVLAHREVAKYLLGTAFFWLGTGGVVPFLTRFGINELGTDEGTAFLLLLVPVLATVVFAVPAGWLGDRYGKKPILIAGLTIMGLSVVVGSQVQNVPQAIAILVITGAANALCAVMLFPLLADLLPEERAGEFTGLGSGVWELAQPTGAVLGGLAADATGSLRTTLLVAAVLTLVAAALVGRVRVPPHTRPN